MIVMVGNAEIRAKREALGWSQSRLADEASALLGSPVHQQAIARIEAGRESRYKLPVLQALDLLPKTDTPPTSAPKARLPLEVELAPDAPPFEKLGLARDVPELGIAVGGEDDDFTLNGEAVDYVTRPRALANRDIFAIRAKGSSMYPRFEEGEIMFVERKREPRPGEDGVFEFKPNDEWEAGRALIKRLVSKGMGVVVVEQFNPRKEIHIQREHLKAMYRVVPNNELFGV